MNAKQLKTKGIIKPTIFEQKPVEPQKNSLKKLKNFKKMFFPKKTHTHRKPVLLIQQSTKVSLSRLSINRKNV